jgi:hypothetical protein
VRQWHKLVVLGDIFPVINQHSLDVIWYRKVDHRFAVKCILLQSVVRIRWHTQTFAWWQNRMGTTWGVQSSGWPLHPVMAEPGLEIGSDAGVA